MSFEIKNIDIIEGFKTLKDSSIDLVCCSPPYNIGIEYDSWNDLMTFNDYFDWSKRWLTECYRVLKDDGRIALNIPFEVNMKHNDIGRIFLTSEYWNIMKSIGFKWFGLVRLNEMSSQRVKFTAWGSYLSPSSPYIYNCEECVLLAYKKTHVKEIKGESDLTKEEFVECVNGLWNYRAETQGLTQACYSLDIPTKAIKMLTYKENVILDPFTGSGTTGVAAIKLNRNFIGFEISKKYSDIAKDRIQYEVDKKNCSLNEMFGN
ncbi:MAG: site-specific DNA-methyltransferase [Candidatus Nanoarchaeia archaeon]|jgi:site-specific DNA-methyltransferase (adenine-specific)|nr:site-specific DNA-methyltransferase [Candidatus Nanoarchaeia archaeon]